MKSVTIAEATRSIAAVLDEVERDQEEVAVVRNRKTIARIVPEPAGQTALEVFADVAGALDSETGDALAKAVAEGRKKVGRRNSVRNPWAT